MTTDFFEIRNDITPPKPQMDREKFYDLFDKMEVGQSFEFPVDQAPTVANAATYYKKYRAEDGREFTTRSFKDAGKGICWRVK